MQWAISLGRWDIQTAVMTMSSFREEPRIGHLNRLQQITAYLSQFHDFKIRFQTDPPDYSQVTDIQELDWTYITYG